MNDPNAEQDSVIAPGELVEVSPLAVEAAAAELAQVAQDVKAGVWSRTLRTLAQGAAAVAVLAASAAVYDGLTSGVYDYRLLVASAGQAALTAVVTYAHNRYKPKS